MKKLIVLFVALSASHVFANPLEEQINAYREDLLERKNLLISYADALLSYYEVRDKFYADDDLDPQYKSRNKDKMKTSSQFVESQVRKVVPQINACLASPRCAGIEFAGQLNSQFANLKMFHSMIYLPASTSVFDLSLLQITHRSALNETTIEVAKLSKKVDKLGVISIPSMPVPETKEEQLVEEKAQEKPASLELCPKNFKRGHGTLLNNGVPCKQRAPLVLNKEEFQVRKKQEEILSNLKSELLKEIKIADFKSEGSAPSPQSSSIQGGDNTVLGSSEGAPTADAQGPMKVDPNKDNTSSVDNSGSSEVDGISEEAKSILTWLKKPEPIKYLEPRKLEELVKIAYMTIKMKENQMHKTLPWTEFMMEVASYDRASNPKIYHEARKAWDENKKKYDKFVMDNILKGEEVPGLLMKELDKDYFKVPDARMMNLVVAMNSGNYSDTTKMQILMSFIGRLAANLPDDVVVGVQEGDNAQIRAVVLDKKTKKVVDISSGETFKTILAPIYSSKLILHYFLQVADMQNYKGNKEDFLLAQGPKKKVEAGSEDDKETKKKLRHRIRDRLKKAWDKFVLLMKEGRHFIKAIGPVLKNMDWSQIKDVFKALAELDAEDIKALMDSGKMSDILEMAKKGKIGYKDLPENVKRQLLLDAQEKYGLSDEEIKKVEVKNLLRAKPIKYLPLTERRKNFESIIASMYMNDDGIINKSVMRKAFATENDQQREDLFVRAILNSMTDQIQRKAKDLLKNNDEFDAVYSGALLREIKSQQSSALSLCGDLAYYYRPTDPLYSVDNLKWRKQDDEGIQESLRDIKYSEEVFKDDELPSMRLLDKRAHNLEEKCMKAVKESIELQRGKDILNFWATKMVESPKAVLTYLEYLQENKQKSEYAMNNLFGFTDILAMIPNYAIAPCEIQDEKRVPTVCNSFLYPKDNLQLYRDASASLSALLADKESVVVGRATSLYREAVEGVVGEEVARDEIKPIEGQSSMHKGVLEISEPSTQTLPASEPQINNLGTERQYIQVKIDEAMFEDKELGDQKDQASIEAVDGDRGAAKKVDKIEFKKRPGVFVPKDAVRISKDSFSYIVKTMERYSIYYNNYSIDKDHAYSDSQKYKDFAKQIAPAQERLAEIK